MRICTWNINSVRIREEQVLRLMTDEKPDILCLQETKVTNDLFPKNLGASLGYSHQLIHGQKSYNGIAILSKVPFLFWERKSWCDNTDCRHAWVSVEGPDKVPIEIHNFYVPAGGDVPDPTVNDKFAYKLQFLAEMASWFSGRRKTNAYSILLGDLNIAPLENDVWSHKQLLSVVSHTPIEIAALETLAQSLNWIDAVRMFFPETEKLYSWWSYRAKDWALSNKGRRLDHIWVTPLLEEFLESAVVVRDTRGWTRPSDHAPVLIDLCF